MTLEDRKCKGCSAKFRTMPQSIQEFCSQDCRLIHTGEQPVFHRKAHNPKKAGRKRK